MHKYTPRTKKQNKTTTIKNKDVQTTALAASPVEESTLSETRRRPTCLDIWALRGRVGGNLLSQSPVVPLQRWQPARSELSDNQAQVVENEKTESVSQRQGWH